MTTYLDHLSNLFENENQGNNNRGYVHFKTTEITMTKKIKLSYSTEILPEHLQQIEKYCEVKRLPWAETDYIPTEAEVVKESSGCEILYVFLDPLTENGMRELKFHGLKLIGSGRGKPNNIDWIAAEKLGIPIVHSPGRNAHSVAEYTIAMIFSVSKRIAFTYNALQSGRFLADPKDIYDVPKKKDVVWRFKDRQNARSAFPWGIDLVDRTIGLIGLGEIGFEVAKMCCALGMNVLAYDPYQSDSLFREANAIRIERWQDMLPVCDFVSVHLNETENTYKLINDEWFDLMREDAYFINTARASVVNQEALINALENRKIAFAALDVMWDEPAPSNHPLLRMDNVLLTPHLAGTCSDVKKRTSKMVMTEILNYAQQKPNLHVWKSTK